IAVGQSLLGLVYRTTQVHIDEMGKLPEEKAAWGALAHHPERRTVPGILVLRLDAPLFWANAATVFDRLLEKILPHDDIHVVLLDLEATNQLDATTERRLESFLDTLRANGKDLYLVRVFHQVRVVMKTSGFFDRLGEGRAWHSISAGVLAAKAVVAVEEAFAAASHDWAECGAVAAQAPAPATVEENDEAGPPGPPGDGSTGIRLPFPRTPDLPGWPEESGPPWEDHPAISVAVPSCAADAVAQEGTPCAGEQDDTLRHGHHDRGGDHHRKARRGKAQQGKTHDRPDKKPKH
ncbi:MAG TPA: sodium-independent anion transporter, partial [Kineosporiaceae bacterium]|nr:sodium-independent anion transporter [Kineosporiaceae bacterium]